MVTSPRFEPLSSLDYPTPPQSDTMHSPVVQRSKSHANVVSCCRALSTTSLGHTLADKSADIIINNSTGANQQLRLPPYSPPLLHKGYLLVILRVSSPCHPSCFPKKLYTLHYLNHYQLSVTLLSSLVGLEQCPKPILMCTPFDTPRLTHLRPQLHLPLTIVSLVWPRVCLLFTLPIVCCNQYYRRFPRLATVS